MMDDELRAEVDLLLPSDPDEVRVLALLGLQHVLRSTRRPYHDVASGLRQLPETAFAFVKRLTTPARPL